MLFRTRCFIRFAPLVFFASAWPYTAFSERIPPPIPATVADKLSKGTAQDLIVLFDDSDVESEAATRRQQARAAFDDKSILAFRRSRYRSIKQSAIANVPLRDMQEIRDFDHLPMSHFRVKNRSALDILLANPRVLAVYEDRPIYPHLAYSLPFIGQPAIVSAGFKGNGQTVAIIDTGIDYTLSAFGSCTAPGTPTGCRVATSVDVTGNGVTLNQTANNHGTNVAGIAAGVAPESRIAAVNAFSNGSSTTNLIIAGINWAISNKSVYNIGALNMSLGDGSYNTALCGNSTTNPFVIPINNLRSAGVIAVASSGNNGYTDGISNPACTPGVVSVGAVYDANWSGPYTWSSGCTDSSSGSDKIPCFSNSASFLTILAPGAFITAAGIQMAGTSQASPHVAGAIALIRAAYSSDTLDQAVSRLTSNGVSITDSRNNVTKPRLKLIEAIDVTAPTVSLTAPTSGSTVSGTATVSASALDNIGVSRVEFYENGTLMYTGTVTPFGFSWDTTDVVNGTYTLSAKAYDTAGNAGQSGNVIVTVANDLIAPIVSLTAPVSGSTVSGTVTISASALDNVGVSKVEFYENGTLMYTGTAAPYSFDWNTTAVANGAYTLVAKAYDAAGHAGQSGNVAVTVNQAASVPALSPWGISFAAVCLAGIAGSLKSKRTERL
jgi:subtilisin family serine protease